LSLSLKEGDTAGATGPEHAADRLQGRPPGPCLQDCFISLEVKSQKIH